MHSCHEPATRLPISEGGSGLTAVETIWREHEAWPRKKRRGRLLVLLALLLLLLLRRDPQGEARDRLPKQLLALPRKLLGGHHDNKQRIPTMKMILTTTLTMTRPTMMTILTVTAKQALAQGQSVRERKFFRSCLSSSPTTTPTRRCASNRFQDDRNRGNWPLYPFFMIVSLTSSSTASTTATSREQWPPSPTAIAHPPPSNKPSPSKAPSGPPKLSPT